MTADRLLYSDGSLVLLSDGSYVLLSTETPDAGPPSAIRFTSASKNSVFQSPSRAVVFRGASRDVATVEDGHALTARGDYAITFQSPDQSVIGAE